MLEPGSPERVDQPGQTRDVPVHRDLPHKGSCVAITGISAGTKQGSVHQASTSQDGSCEARFRRETMRDALVPLVGNRRPVGTTMRDALVPLISQSSFPAEATMRDALVLLVGIMGFTGALTEDRATYLLFVNPSFSQFTLLPSFSLAPKRGPNCGRPIIPAGSGQPSGGSLYHQREDWKWVQSTDCKPRRLVRTACRRWRQGS